MLVTALMAAGCSSGPVTSSISASIPSVPSATALATPATPSPAPVMPADAHSVYCNAFFNVRLTLQAMNRHDSDVSYADFAAAAQDLREVAASAQAVQLSMAEAPNWNPGSPLVRDVRNFAAAVRTAANLDLAGLSSAKYWTRGTNAGNAVTKDMDALVKVYGPMNC